MDPRKKLVDLKPVKDFFIGIDSDGCVFDTMEIKHKECFCPNFIKYFDLRTTEKYARETWEFVNLNSINRGCNRFDAVIHSLDLLLERREFKAINNNIYDIKELKEWLKIENSLGNGALEKYMDLHPTPFLRTLLYWSEAVNKSIEDIAFSIPPFPFVKESLPKMSKKADMIVVSQAPLDTLMREWEENNINGYVRTIASQELGTKTDQLKCAAIGKYKADHILMIGDAPGDFIAAKSNGVLFYPINPGHESVSWERFYEVAMDHFFNGTFKGEYEDMLLEEFKSYLQEIPPWKK